MTRCSLPRGETAAAPYVASSKQSTLPYWARSCEDDAKDDGRSRWRETDYAKLFLCIEGYSQDSRARRDLGLEALLAQILHVFSTIKVREAWLFRATSKTKTTN